jgi:type II secretory pathway predicted ATPase ExeA
LSNELRTHFGFSRLPFTRHTPKEAFFRHPGYEEALRRLRFTVELDGVAVLMAEAGCGKSLLLGELADELQREGRAVHYFAHCTVGPFGLVNVLARKAGLAPRRSRAETAMALSETLCASDRKHLVVCDEAHLLSDETMEDLRLLTIADFDRKSPFLLVLAGQPQLDDRLADPTHHALDQRIPTFARLAPLGPDETSDYLLCRLAAAGTKGNPVFEQGAVEAIYEASGGVPRRINNVANGALVVAASRNRRIVTAQDVHDAKLDRGRS